MVTQIFRLSIFAMVITAVLVILTPVLTVNSLLFPIRIDSLYVDQQQTIQSKLKNSTSIDTNSIFLYSPQQLQVPYSNFNLTLRDSITLKGWLVLDSTKKQAPLLLIIPDIKEGAISYLPAVQQYFDRGFHVCVMDMRGQGRSEGTYYDFATTAANDLHEIVIELKKNNFINKIAIFGNGTGSAIITKAVSDSSGIADVMILQNPIVNLSDFFVRQVQNEWGQIIIPLIPPLKRSYEQQTKISLHNFNYKEMMTNLYVPHLVVAANYFSQKNINDALEIYHASNYYRKRFYIDKSTFMVQMGFGNGKTYYDKLSAFINSSLPSISKKNRFRKLVLR